MRHWIVVLVGEGFVEVNAKHWVIEHGRLIFSNSETDATHDARAHHIFAEGAWSHFYDVGV